MAEEEFRGVCREALMAKLHSSEPLDIEDLEGEVCAMELSEGVKERILSEERRLLDRDQVATFVAPFRHDNLGDQTPLVGAKTRMRMPIKQPPPERHRRPGEQALHASREGPAVSAAPPPTASASLLPVPSMAHQMPVPGQDLPSVLLLEGFRVQNLNQAFQVNQQILVCGYPTYWDRDRSYFLYFHQKDQRWVISPRLQEGADMLMQAQSGVMLGCAFQYLDDVWNELLGAEWKKAPQVRVTPLEQVGRTPSFAGAQPLPSRPRRPPAQASAPAPVLALERETAKAAPSKQAFVDTVHIRGGFRNPQLNTIYLMDTSLQVGSRATYWDDHRRFFMYYQAVPRRWAISLQDLTTGENMLENARRGGLCGFAFEVDKTSSQWREYYEGRWVNVQIDIQKLCTGKRAPLAPVGLPTKGSAHAMQPPETPKMSTAPKLPAKPAPKAPEPKAEPKAKPEAKAEPVAKPVEKSEKEKPEASVKSESQERRKRKGEEKEKEKKAKKLEKEERARRKENKMKERIRQEMLAARAQKPSSSKGAKMSPKKPKSPKKAKSKKEREDRAKRARNKDRNREDKAREKDDPSGKTRPETRRWKASVAAKWPAFWSEEDAAPEPEGNAVATEAH